MSASVFTDRSGQTWDIPDLLYSDRPRIRRFAGVSELLDPLLDQERWGAGVGTVRQALQQLDATADVPDQHELERGTSTGHAAYIRHLVAACRSGWEPEPLVIGLDGGLWDGLHRLAALGALGIERVKVDDFSSSTLVNAPPVPAEALTRLLSLLSAPWGQPETLSDLRLRLRSAAGYPRCLLPAFLTPTLANHCYGAVSHLTWDHHETEFFVQDEFVLDERVYTLPPVWKTLTDLLLGDDLLAYVRWITGNTLLERPEAVVHRMRPGDYIGVHNDYRPGGNRFRCVLYLGQQDADLQHGAFVAVADGRGENILDVFPPAHNSVVMFEISRRSFHLVTEIEDTSRFSVILSYHEPPVVCLSWKREL